MSDTPRTDAVWNLTPNDDLYVELREIARDLERELGAANRSADACLEEIDRLRAARTEVAAITGEKSRASYAPSRSIARDDDQHLYVFHNGLWYHFAPKGWVAPSPLETIVPEKK